MEVEDPDEEPEEGGPPDEPQPPWEPEMDEEPYDHHDENQEEPAVPAEQVGERIRATHFEEAWRGTLAATLLSASPPVAARSAGEPWCEDDANVLWQEVHKQVERRPDKR